MTVLPPPNAPVWERLALGKITHKFSLFAANMAITHAVRAVAMNPENKSSIVSELHQFFCKYEHLVAKEIKAIA